MTPYKLGKLTAKSWIEHPTTNPPNTRSSSHLQLSLNNALGQGLSAWQYSIISHSQSSTLGSTKFSPLIKLAQNLFLQNFPKFKPLWIVSQQQFPIRTKNMCRLYTPSLLQLLIITARYANSTDMDLFTIGPYSERNPEDYNHYEDVMKPFLRSHPTNVSSANWIWEIWTFSFLQGTTPHLINLLSR